MVVSLWRVLWIARLNYSQHGYAVLAKFDCFHLDYSYTNVTYVPSKNVAIFIFIIVLSYS